MTTDHRRVEAELVQEVLLCERVVQQILEAVMTEHLGGAAPYERLEVRTAFLAHLLYHLAVTP